MSKSITNRMNSIAHRKDAENLRPLIEAILTDLGVLRTPVVASITDYTAGRAELAKLLTDFTSARTALVNLRLSQINMCLASAAIAIAATTTKIKTVTNPTPYLIDGVFYSKAATDNFWTLTGFDCTNAKYNKCLLCIDSSGNAQIAAGTQADAAADVVLPAIPSAYCVMGMVQVHPTGTGNFTGGTTALGDGTVVPNAVYTNMAFHPGTFAAPATITASAPAAVSAVAPAALTLLA